MYLCEFRIESDCGLAEAASNLMEPIISLQVYPFAKRKNYLMAYTSANDTAELRKDFAKDFVEVNFVKDKRGLFIHGIKQGHGVMDAIIEAGNIPLFPIFAYNGHEHFFFISTNKERSKESTEAISLDNYVSSKTIRQVTSDELFGLASGMNNFFQVAKLTDTELRVLREAYSSGYYEWPRPNDLGEVSKTLNLSKPTVLYHMRNAEKKIIGSLLNKN